MMRAPCVLRIFAFRILLIATTLLQNATGDRCTGKQILRDSSGIISDGTSNYTEYARCEWLIDAFLEGQVNDERPRRTIQLSFLSMETECSYDFLLVFDGKSYQSPLLASLSGNSVPDTIIARSGYMLIFLYSDRNYQLQGFEAQYMITNCPFDCSRHGNCSNYVCHCHEGYTGEACNVEVCPKNCHGHGRCITEGEQIGCSCDLGFSGQECDLDTLYENGTGTWYTLKGSSSEFIPRTGHAGVFIDSTNCLWIFGGYTLNDILGDLVKFCLDKNTWETLPKNSNWPSPRYGHAVAESENGFYLFGGVHSNAMYSNELWFYNVSTNHWSQLAMNSSIQPLNCTGHTITTVENWLYLFGGKTTDGMFSSLMYKINTHNPLNWEVVHSRGSNISTRRLVGHSTVYHKESKSLIVFGGYTPDHAQYSIRMNASHTFSIEDRYWSELEYSQSQMTERAFHTANIMGNYMVVYGGNCHKHHHNEVCYDNGLHFYHLGCHTWLEVLEFFGHYHFKKPSRGRFSHVAAVAHGNILLIAGGYAGYVYGDIIAYKVPSSVAPHKSRQHLNTDHCSSHQTATACYHDPECLYCAKRLDTESEGCVHKSKKEICDSKRDFRISRCPGICEALKTCEACLSQGKGPRRTPTTVPMQKQNDECIWCVKESKCQKKSHPLDTCRQANITRSGIIGWWNGLSPKLGNMSQCRTDNYPAGMQWIHYHSPINDSHPDVVINVRETQQQYSLSLDTEKKRRSMRKTILKGYIHPLKVSPTFGDVLHLYLGANAVEASLSLSTDDLVENKESVANISRSTSYKMKTATRRSGEPLFKSIERGHKYYIEQTANFIIFPTNISVESHISVDWNAFTSSKDRSKTHAITSEFLEPYQNGTCSIHSNCLSCMTDAACGWCAPISRCLVRDDPESDSSLCGGLEPSSFLITAPVECPRCKDHVSCQLCAVDVVCEWNVQESECIRRGSLTSSVRNITECHPECHKRPSCTECIKPKDECAWCENLQTCLPFSDYVPRYIYGQCLEWTDGEGTGQTCHDCSVHNGCKSCLLDYGCGWCGNIENPTSGRCISGDFRGPHSGSRCPALIAEVHNATELQPAQWSYGLCPNVDECALGLHDCHPNATCNDTFDSYFCKCNRGFNGDGKERCEKTCYYECRFGECSKELGYKCKCDIGWTGEECFTDCGCNMHSYCSQGVGKCDRCEHLTTGEHCELCRHGSYSTQDKPFEDCLPCNCNGHGDASRGQCNNNTGKCYCKDNTVGRNCERCAHGYYGDARNGGTCYLKCNNRQVINNITFGALGSLQGSGVGRRYQITCLWILTVFDNINTKYRMDNTVPTITFTVEGIKVDCRKEYVYVYDGIPDYVSGNSFSHSHYNSSADNSGILLGAFCSNQHRHSQSVLAKSGILTVYFNVIRSEGFHKTGFNATYHINKCPWYCFGNRVCTSGKCKCKEGYGGVNCDIQLCSHNCSECPQGRGRCDKNEGLCVCDWATGDKNASKHLPYGYSGVQILYDVNRDLFSSSGEWIKLTGLNMLHRAGHSLINCGADKLYLYGGYSLEFGVLNDIWEYDIMTSHWKEIKLSTDLKPSGSYYHAAACIPVMKLIVVYGGMVSTGGYHPNFYASKELWIFSIDQRMWSKPKVPNWMPALAGHTLNRVNDTKLILFGGFSTLNYYSNRTFEYDASRDIFAWKEIVMSNRKISGTVPVGMFGHSAVYHAATDNIYVFGGWVFKSDKSFVSDDVYTYEVGTKRWNLLQPEKYSRREPRYFHTAVIINNTMIVIGGKTKWGNSSGTILLYRMQCNFWHSIEIKNAGDGYDIGEMYASAAVVSDGSIFIMGGFSGQTKSTLVKVHVPTDVCNVETDLNRCRAIPGCSACFVVLPNGENRTYCFSPASPIPEMCYLDGNNVSILDGTNCDLDWYHSRSCYQYTNCSQCLSVLPFLRHAQQVCKWCSNCPNGKCIPADRDCKVENKCEMEQRGIENVGECVEHLCQASDCHMCLGLKTCMWTRQFMRASDVGRFVSPRPLFDWNCVTATLKDAAPYIIQTMPPDECLPACNTFTSCSTCLESIGGEGGSKECVWSETLHECMPPAYVPLHCSMGECGTIIQGDKDKHCHLGECGVANENDQDRCPAKCWKLTKCSDCITYPGCGWCAFDGLNGIGVCMPGGLKSANERGCSASIDRRYLKVVDIKWWLTTTGPPNWAYYICPPENECSNNHHDCDMDTEECRDTSDSYRCECKPGYVKLKGTDVCTPVCHQGCVNGQCAAPDKCQCNFGWVGENCSTECNCNKHSNCKSETEKDVCLKCQNNTQGTHCDECKPMFVGDPTNGGKCTSCREFCNNHTDVCLRERDVSLITSKDYRGSDIHPAILQSKNPQIPSFVRRGPRREEAACVCCKDNTEGKRCEDCQRGYFRRREQKPTSPCLKCMCNGHSDSCDKQTGENCKCQNNTETHCGGKDNSEECWKTQCSKCKEYFMGTPTDGHHCYRQMTVDRGYCFDPDTQRDCNDPSPLKHGRHGRPVFFAVQPKYLNVDIRITIDVTEGSIDVFFSPHDDTYIVHLDMNTSIHSILLDSSYKVVKSSKQRWKRGAGRGESHNFQVYDEQNTTNKTSKVYYLEQIDAEDLNTFVTVANPNTFLLVKNVRCRLVITLPLDVHDLRSSRFYLILQGNNFDNFGNLYFRQDQPRIDLFVFFSVFFSCFFLFLAVCVLLWKLKQAFDVRRNRQLRELEMEHMASRPFAKVLLYVEQDLPHIITPPVQRKRRFPRFPQRSHHPQMCNFSPIHSVKDDVPFIVSPVAIEPTDDGVAEVGSVIFQLPGGSMAPSRLCLGSTLTMRITSNMSFPSKNYRRRPSAMAV